MKITSITMRLVSATALLGMASISMWGQINLPKTGVAGSTHDIQGQGCKGCHAPHNGPNGTIQLWATDFPASGNTFGVYSTVTSKNPAQELGGSALTSSSDVRMYSLLCLSCHDGVTSQWVQNTANMVGSRASFGNNVVTGKAAFESMGLTNDHPINMTYDPTKNTSLQPVATVTNSLPLYGGTVQCATCHDPHSNQNTNYLRQQNGAAHCTTCHM